MSFRATRLTKCSEKPDGQMHTNDELVTAQVAPFKHGLLEHGLLETEITALTL